MLNRSQHGTIRAMTALAALVVTAGLGSVATGSGIDRPYADFSGSAVDPVVEKFKEDLSFYLTFDGPTLRAQIAGGRSAPTGIIGELQFERGVRGEALRIGAGGAMVTYAYNGNLDATQDWCMAFWVQAAQWADPDQEVGRGQLLFAGVARDVQAGVGSVMAAGRMGFSRRLGRRDSPMFFSEAWTQMQPFVLTAGASLRWSARRDAWHLYVINKNDAGISLSIDGRAERHTALQGGPLVEADFPDGAGATWLFLGQDPSTVSEGTLIDEIMLFRRTLTSDEVAFIFDVRGGTRQWQRQESEDEAGNAGR